MLSEFEPGKKGLKKQVKTDRATLRIAKKERSCEKGEIPCKKRLTSFAILVTHQAPPCSVVAYFCFDTPAFLFFGRMDEWTDKCRCRNRV